MTEQSWFNLNINGIGYVNRIREVTPKRGDPFLCCDIAALEGPSDDVEYLRFDCRVTGKDAQQLIRRCTQACEDKRKILIQFRLGDLYTDTFVYSKGDRKGQTGVSLKAHLLFIGLIRIDGEEVYRAERPAAVEVPDATEPPAEKVNNAESDSKLACF
ncbi:hypothetical protein J2125_003939 [Erwinia toletana]|uniref:DUF3577 domain-containing protein n=1 Tax=Winslowiella toletana TaxID=92490 RepID=A0ABS4PDN7_9GAMM|nr:STY4534 family ICE replication protein [Winslowiella toletana]MBP2170747.1 hypothetical protein [Winslowiella toletana]